MAIARSMLTEQHHAVTIAPVRVGVVPAIVLVEPHQRLDPAGTIKIRPLVGETQVHLDDAPADGFEIDHAAVAGEMRFDPGAGLRLDLRVGLGVDGPVIERAPLARLAGRGGPTRGGSPQPW